MSNIFDWKFWLTLTIAIASVVVPVWLWRSDLASRALTMTVTSKAALSPTIPHTPNDLQISVGGKILTEPYSSVIEITNTGSKPILAAEIEGNIVLEVTSPSEVVNVQVVKNTPESLSPIVSAKNRRVSLHPLLLNPGDAVTLAVLTERGIPSFLPRARIAGIADVSLRESGSGLERGSGLNRRGKWLGLISAPIAISAVFMLMLMRLDPKRTFYFPVVTLASFGVLASSALAAGPIWDEYFPKSVLSTLGFSVLVTLIGALLALVSRKKVRNRALTTAAEA